jgi:hypothetical protein
VLSRNQSAGTIGASGRGAGDLHCSQIFPEQRAEAELAIDAECRCSEFDEAMGSPCPRRQGGRAEEVRQAEIHPLIIEAAESIRQPGHFARS